MPISLPCYSDYPFEMSQGRFRIAKEALEQKLTRTLEQERDQLEGRLNSAPAVQRRYRETIERLQRSCSQLEEALTEIGQARIPENQDWVGWAVRWLALAGDFESVHCEECGCDYPCSEIVRERFKLHSSPGLRLSCPNAHILAAATDVF